MSPALTTVHHGRVELALHTLRDGPGRPLLLLHGLGEATPASAPAAVSSWPGPIVGLDFTGHGRSSVPRGGGYSAEILLGDVDAVLAELGPLSILGRGVGAYVGLLAAGSRASLVRGVVLADGPGLHGGGTQPASPAFATPHAGLGAGPPDPWALLELARDIRPPDYALTYLRFALERSELTEPVLVTAVLRPEWLAAVVDDPEVVTTTPDDALARLAAGAVR